MRPIIPLLSLLLASLVSFVSASPIDSLRGLLAQTTAPAAQIRIYRDLADATAETPKACKYLAQLIEQARKAGQTRTLMEGLSDIVWTYLQIEKLDSAYYYERLAEQYAPKGQRDRWCCLMRMWIFYDELSGENASRVVENKIASFKTRNISDESPYQQIEAEFAIASALNIKGQSEQAAPHLETMLRLARKQPFREGFPYQLIALRHLARVYNEQALTEQGAELLKEAIEIREKYYKLYEQELRPFLSLDGFYITNYSSLLINLQHMPDAEVRHYLDKLVELSDHSQDPAHKYNRFLAQFNYSVIRKDLRQALIYNDSLARYARQIAVYNLPRIYQINATILEMFGEYDKALGDLREYYRLQDSISRNNLQDKIYKLRMEYDVNHLNYENSHLEIRNKHLLLIMLGVLLTLVTGLCVYLYRHLKRERHRQKHMQRLRMQAEEGEKLKTAFLDSICHEIRTPLNNIVEAAGQLIAAPSDELPGQSSSAIGQNSTQLLALIDSMLEVASLDVSEEGLPRSAADVADICRTAFRRFAGRDNKSGIASLAQLPNGPLMASTNNSYLLLVIEHLLENAYKFTNFGSITLCCEQRERQIVISVTDTGCGIPSDKQHQVFERFIKLDPKKEGNGLGLYLCRIIIRKLSGSLTIDPTYTKGTRMIVCLPIK